MVQSVSEIIWIVIRELKKRIVNIAIISYKHDFMYKIHLSPDENIITLYKQWLCVQMENTQVAGDVNTEWKTLTTSVGKAALTKE